MANSNGRHFHCCLLRLSSVFTALDYFMTATELFLTETLKSVHMAPSCAKKKLDLYSMLSVIKSQLNPKQILEVSASSEYISPVFLLIQSLSVTVGNGRI